MTVELRSYGQVDFDEQAKVMSPEQLFDQLGRDNMELARLGVKISITIIVYGARRYGNNYEYRTNIHNQTRPTPMNCFMALLHNQPELGQLPQEDFEKLGKVVSRISVATEALAGKINRFDWPEQFSISPQFLLQEPKP